jgi:hypothetical protein
MFNDLVLLIYTTKSLQYSQQRGLLFFLHLMQFACEYIKAPKPVNLLWPISLNIQG